MQQFRKLFSPATFASQIVPFRSYLASKLTLIENSTRLAFWRSPCLEGLGEDLRIEISSFGFEV